MSYERIYIILIFLFFILVASSAGAIDKKFDVNIDQITFEESIAKLSEIFDVNITLMGINNLTQSKFNLTLRHATLEQAIKEAMRKVGLQNHILDMDQQSNFTRVWILPNGTIKDTSDQNVHSNKGKGGIRQYTQLEPTQSENFRMMTQEEYDRLEPESDKNYRSMTSEEFKKLEAAESKNFKTLTQEEYNLLEPELDKNYRGMTPEEFAKLEKEL